MNNRNRRAEIARETLMILEEGHYAVNDKTIYLEHDLIAMKRDTRLYTPASLVALNQQNLSSNNHVTTIEVINATTFAGARHLIDRGIANLCCLNFASAKNPGGGFLGGAQAQEECLSRASGLYASLLTQPEYYDNNRRHRSCLYTNHMIYSPGVPVFRDDNDHLLQQPYKVSMITSPAVNTGAVSRNEPDNISQIEPTMKARIRSVLRVAADHGHDALVLGAWGCGVFGNDPENVAQWFRQALTDDSLFQGLFKHVVFAVLDHSRQQETYHAFNEIL